MLMQVKIMYICIYFYQKVEELRIMRYILLRYLKE